MNILQINSVVNSGSTGRIAEDIGKVLMNAGHNSTIAFGRGNRPSQSKRIKIGTDLDLFRHGAATLLLDRHGLASKSVTKSFLRQLEELQPDAIGLQNLHGYYINYPLLFEFIKAHQIPVLWTFHDCWPFTGHCAHFMRVNCAKWQTHCESCPMTNSYPKSLVRDRSYQNFENKKMAFLGVDHLKIVTPSRWLKKLVKKSFLKNYPAEVVHNGIDLDTFRQSNNNVSVNKLVLGVASTWSDQKGLKDFTLLREKMPSDWELALIGLSPKQLRILPEGVNGVERTESLPELVKWYNRATIFVNPTYIDNFPSTNIEALACGTPVVTYDTGGSAETIDKETGRVVEMGDISGLDKAIRELSGQSHKQLTIKCRLRAEKYFNRDERYKDYLRLYEELVKESSKKARNQ